MATINTIDKEIAELEEKLAKLKLEKKVFEGLSEPEYLAEMLHEKQCRWNHTDGCGWFYESWAQPGHSRNEYLKKAKGMLSEVSFAQAVKLIKHM